MAKKQKVSVVKQEDGALALTVEYPTINKTFRIADLLKFPESIRLDAMIHGFKQKFGDAASGDTPQVKYAMVQRIAENLSAGNWELVSVPDNSGIVIEAVARIKKVKVPKIEAALEKVKVEDEETLDDAKARQIKEWASNAKVKAVIAQIRAERAAKVADEADDEDLEIEV